MILCKKNTLEKDARQSKSDSLAGTAVNNYLKSNSINISNLVGKEGEITKGAIDILKSPKVIEKDANQKEGDDKSFVDKLLDQSQNQQNNQRQ